MSSIYSVRDHYILPALGICFGLLLLIFFEPLSYDNAIFHQMAREIYQYHRLPYIGTWDQNFPGIIYLHYISIAIFGTADTTVRIIDILLQIGFCFIFYRLCRLWLTEYTAVVASVPGLILFLFYAQIPGGLKALYFATIRFNLDIYVQHYSPFRDIEFNLLRTAFLFPFAAYGLWLLRNSKADRYRSNFKSNVN